MAIPASFSAKRDIAYAGMPSDTSLYNIDGACASKGVITAGLAVRVDSIDPKGHKVLAPITADTQPPYGIATRSHFCAPDGTYHDGDPVNVMSHGRVWVQSADTSAPTFGSTVNFDATGKQKQTGAIKTLWTFAGGWFKTKAGVQLIEVQVKQSAVQDAFVAP